MSGPRLSFRLRTKLCRCHSHTLQVQAPLQVPDEAAMVVMPLPEDGLHLRGSRRLFVGLAPLHHVVEVVAEASDHSTLLAHLVPSRARMAPTPPLVVMRAPIEGTRCGAAVTEACACSQMACKGMSTGSQQCTCYLAISALRMPSGS